MKCLSKRKMGVIETADRLYGNRLYGMDCQHFFLNTNLPGKRVGVLKPYNVLRNLKKGETPFKSNFVDDYYVRRPASLENFSLFNIFCNYRYS